MSFKKQYQNLHFKDDFMFGVVMSDINIAKKVLSVILAEDIPNIENCELQKVVDNDTASHGVRYDVYIQTEDGKKVYDIEMQTANNDDLPKRSRYYQSSSDMDFLSKGKLYKHLPENYVIFICEFDLFGKQNAVYKFENYCVKEQIYLSDKTYKIFLNTTGKTERKELQNLMTYITDNIPNDSLTNEIDNKITNARHSGKLYSSYIKEQQNAMMLEEKARAEGRAEGWAEGRAEGEAKGEVKGIAKTIRQLLKNGLTTEKIVSLLELSNEEAKLYFNDRQTV